mmetsp:Transcript_6775/g.14170  ORF Transcript_6775/g.14170 Transcript_6775/m.14170 type:complete len:819 (+) Transcript_6775:43-2499(+)
MVLLSCPTQPQSERVQVPQPRCSLRQVGHLPVQGKAEPGEPDAEGSDRRGGGPASTTRCSPPAELHPLGLLKLLLRQQGLHDLVVLGQVVVQVVQHLLPPLLFGARQLGDVDGVHDGVQHPLRRPLRRLRLPVLGLELREGDHPVVGAPSLHGGHLDVSVLGELLEEAIVGDVLHESHPLLPPLGRGKAVKVLVQLVNAVDELLLLEGLLLRAALNPLDVLLPLLGRLLDALRQLPGAHEPHLVAVFDELLDHLKLLLVVLALHLPVLVEEVLHHALAPLQPIPLEGVLPLLPVLLLVLLGVELDVLLHLLFGRVKDVLVPPGAVRALLEELLRPVGLGLLDVAPLAAHQVALVPRQVVHLVDLVVVLRDLGEVLLQALVLGQGVGLADRARGHPFGAVGVEERVLLNGGRGSPPVLEVPQGHLPVRLVLEHPRPLDHRVELLQDALDQSVVAQVLWVDPVGRPGAGPEPPSLDVVDRIGHELVPVPGPLLDRAHDLVPRGVPGLRGRLPLLDELHHGREVEHGPAAVFLTLHPLPPEHLSFGPRHLAQALHGPGPEHALVLDAPPDVRLHQVAGVRVSQDQSAVSVGNVLPREALVSRPVVPNDAVPLQGRPGERGVRVVGPPETHLGVYRRVPHGVRLEALLVHHRVVRVDLLELLHLQLVRGAVVRGVPVEVPPHVGPLPWILRVRGLRQLHAVRVVLPNLYRLVLPIQLAPLALLELLLQLPLDVLLDRLHRGVLPNPVAVRLVPRLQSVLVPVLPRRQVQVLLRLDLTVVPAVVHAALVILRPRVRIHRLPSPRPPPRRHLDQHFTQPTNLGR